jgi:hypothetical protein
MFQSLAGFASSTKQGVSPDDVILMRDGNEVCISIAGSICAPLDFNFSEVSSILGFVASGNHIAFTAPSSADDPADVEDIALSKGLEKSRYGEHWIARDLDTARLYEILNFIDFSPDFVDDTSDKFEGRRREENALSGLEYTEEDFLVALLEDEIADGTYFNADFYADYLVSVGPQGDLVCDGIPARYHWFLKRGDSKAFLIRVDPAFVGAGVPSINQDALSLFCTTAIIRRLYEDAPNSLQIFR